MKKLIIILFAILYGASLFAQQSKTSTSTVTISYTSTYSETRDDELTYFWISFVKDDGTVVGFEVNDNDVWAENVELLFMNGFRGEVTKKENIGKKFIIGYLEFGGKIISAKPVQSDNSISSPVKSGSIVSVKIGNQVWMNSNLNVSTYRNGDIIPEVQDFKEWMELKTGAWCYNSFSSNKEKLYNWYAVIDPRGLAPDGWYIPSSDEWKILINNLGGGAQALSKMKNTTGWEQQNDEHEGNSDFNGTNVSGFSAIPTGLRCGYGDMDFDDNSYWWSSTEDSKITAYNCHLYYEVNSQVVIEYNTSKNFGLAVRCIKD